MTDIFPPQAPAYIATSADLGRVTETFPYYGRLEGRYGTRLIGWALSVDAPDSPLSLTIIADRHKAAVVPDQAAPALSRLLGRPIHCGFDVDLAVLFPGLPPADIAVSVQITATGHILENALPAQTKPRLVTANVDAVEGARVIGWAVNTEDENEAVELDILIDDHPPTGVIANRQRRDLLARFTTCGHGFEAVLPPCSGRRLMLRDRNSGAIVFGPMEITLEPPPPARQNDQIAVQLEQMAQALQQIRAALPAHRRAAAHGLADYDAYFTAYYQETAARRQATAALAAALPRRPRFSVVVPVCDPPLWMLAEAIESVQAQVYDNWELCLADDASSDDGVRALIRQAAERDGRIRAVFAAQRGGVSVNTNRALSLAEGDYIAFLDHDDRLADDALVCMAAALNEQASPVLYSDEDRIAPDGRRVDPVFKPDFDPELLLSINYVCHLLVAERRLVLEVGGLRPGFEGLQDHDLTLRLLEQVGPAGFRHVPRVLYHWRINPASLSGGGDPAAILAGLERCVGEHLTRTGTHATVAANSETRRRSGGLFCARVRYPLPAPAPGVSIIIPTKDAVELVRDCVSSLLSRTEYPNYEIVVVDHDSADPRSRPFFDSLTRDPRVRVMDYHGAFNWSAINNTAATTCRGDALCFINNDIMAIDSDWLSEMMSLLARPGVGAVGAKLLYPNDTVQHAGVILGLEGAAGHAFTGLDADAPGYLGQAALRRTVSAVTGACLLTSRAAFTAVGGFEMADFPVAYGDVDYCLRLGRAGWRTLWTPYARLHHLETQTRGADDTPEKAARLALEASRLRRRWGEQLNDPCYNPHFEPAGPAYGLLRPPPEHFHGRGVNYTGGI